MIGLIKNILDTEFAANDIQIEAKVTEGGWDQGKVFRYDIRLLYRGSQRVLDMICDATPPYKPKLIPANMIEPHKMIRLCEIIQEAFKELERRTTQDDFR